MANNGTTTDLIIRTKEIQTKPLADLLVILDKLTGALGALEREGGPASKNIAELRSEAEKFQALSNEIAGRRALFESFKGAKDGAALAAKALAEAKAQLAAFSEGPPAVRKRTEEQAETYAKLNAAVRGASASFRSADKILATSTDKLARIGVTSEQVVVELDKLAAADARVTAGLTQATLNVQGYYEAKRRLAQATKDQAEASAREAAQLKVTADAARKAEQAESDRLAIIQRSAQLAAAARGKQDLAAENVQIAEAAALTKRLAEAKNADALASKKSEQAESDRLAGIQQAAAAAQRLQAQQALAAEQAAQKDADVLTRRLALQKQAQEQASRAATLQSATPGGASTAGVGARVAAIVAPKDVAPALSEIERQLAAVEQRQSSFRAGSIQTAKTTQDLAQDYEFLATALKATEQQATKIESFGRMRSDFEATSAAIAKARAALEQLAVEARNTGVSEDALKQGLAAQKAELDRLTGTYLKQKEALAAVGQQMRAAGVDVASLSEAEAKVLGNAERLRSAMNQAADGTTQLGQATGKARKEFSLWGEEQRTALSLTQRIRGQILSLTAAYVGLFGVINEGKAILDAATQQTGIQNRLAVAFGDDPKVVAEQYAKIRAEAERLGISIAEAGQGYSKFAIAAKAGGLSADESFFVFSKFSEVGRTFKLSTEEMGRVFKALEQIMSKGKFSAEEVTQQLGDVLPGAYNTLASSLKLTTAQLGDAMKKGQVDSRNMLLFAQEFGDKVKDRIVPATQTWQAELARLQTSLFEFRNKIADGGFSSAMTALAKDLNAGLNGDAGAQGVRLLGDAFSFVAEVLRAAIPLVTGFFSAIVGAASGLQAVLGGVFDVVNAIRGFLGLGVVSGVTAMSGALRVLGEVLGVLAAVWAVDRVAAFGARILEAIPAVGLLTTGVAALNKAVLANIVVITALLSYEIAKYFYDNFVAVQKFGIGFIGLFTTMKAAIDGVIPAIIDSAAYLVRAMFATLVDGITSGVRKVGSLVAGGLNTVGATDTANEVLKATAGFGEAYVAELKGSAEKARGAMVKSAGAMRRGVIAEMNVIKDQAKALDFKAPAAAGKSNRGLLNASEGQSAARVSQKPILGNGDDKEAAKAAKKAAAEAAALLKNVTNQVEALELRAARSGSNGLADALAAIDLQYQELFKNIDKIGGKVGEGLRTRAQAALKNVKDDATQEFLRKDSQAKVDALIAERDALVEVKKIQADLDPSKRSQALQEETAILIDYRDKILLAGEAALYFAEKQNKTVEAAKLRGVILKAQAQDPEKEARKAQLADLQTQIQRTTELRDAEIALAVEKANLADPTGGLAQRETVRVMTDYRDRLLEANAAARALAVAMKDPNAVATLDLMAQKLQVVDENAKAVNEKIAGDIVTGLTDVGVAAVNGLGNAITGAQSLGEAFKGAGNAFRSFASMFLTEIVKMIVKAQVLAAYQKIQQASNFFTSLITGTPSGGIPAPGGSFDYNTLGSVGFQHNGGVLSAGSSNWTMQAPASVFAGAARFHNGGLPGLKQGEIPIIAQQGEEVLSRTDPRNALNGGLNQGGGGMSQQNIKIINTIDPGEVVSHGLSGASGEQAYLNRVSASREQTRKILGIK